jgi:hypothetical protein
LTCGLHFPYRRLILRSPVVRPADDRKASGVGSLRYLFEDFEEPGYLLDEDVDHLVDGLHEAGLPER